MAYEDLADKFLGGLDWGIAFRKAGRDRKKAEEEKKRSAGIEAAKLGVDPADFAAGAGPSLDALSKRMIGKAAAEETETTERANYYKRMPREQEPRPQQEQAVGQKVDTLNDMLTSLEERIAGKNKAAAPWYDIREPNRDYLPPIDPDKVAAEKVRRRRNAILGL